MCGSDGNNFVLDGIVQTSYVSSYQDAITLLGNKSHGLLTKDSEGKSRANANSSGVTPNEILQSMNSGKDSVATTVTQKFSDMKDTLSNLGKKK